MPLPTHSRSSCSGPPARSPRRSPVGSSADVPVASCSPAVGPTRSPVSLTSCAPAFDADAVATHRAVLDGVFDGGDIDVTVMAFAVLGDQQAFTADPALAAAAVHTNMTGSVSSGLVVADRLRQQGHGVLVVLSSVAGERVRAANLVYGATKAGLDAFAQGLGDSLVGTGARVLVVRPGFVRTKMTTGMPEAPFTTGPEAVADAVVDGLRRGAHTVWSPPALRYVFMGLRHLPRPLWRRMPG